MASLLQLRRRVRAAQNVSKTTKAMQMIAASKLKRAQNAALASRPYTEKLSTLTLRITNKIDKDYKHPYIQGHTVENKTLLIFLSPDKGLCGALITNLLREFLQFQKTEKETKVVVVGKKAEAQVVKLRKEIIASFLFGTSTPTFDMVYPISRIIDQYYLTRQVDFVKILYPHFTSIFTQVPKILTVLPISLPIQETNQKDKESFYLFEPNIERIVPTLLRHYLEMTIYQSLLESFVSEQASRMIAMQNATNNAKDIIEDLLLEYNKTRQAKITSEILDITSGRFELNE